MSESEVVKKSAGRPPKYTGEVLETIIALLKENTVLGTQKIMEEKHGKKICMPTLLKIGHENGLVRKPGAPKKEKKNTVSNIETVETPSDASTDAA
jgi:hypothetical protein